MVTSSSKLASNPPSLTKTRPPHSVSDNSGRRGRIIFLPRRHVRVRHQKSTSQRHGRHRFSSPVHIASYSSSSDGSPGATERPSTGDPVIQNQTRLGYDTQFKPGIFSSPGHTSEASPMITNNRQKPVSPLHMSEMDVLTLPKRVSSSSLRDHPKTTDTHKYVTPSRVPGTDVFGVTSTTKNDPGLNNELVEAISRNIAQQLHLLTIKDESPRAKHNQKEAAQPVSDSPENESRTTSQREALDHFTQELQQYAEQSGAKGKLPILTPTPPRSGTSLRTISALLPFRSEFKAAGLAITSEDQANQQFYPGALKYRAKTTPNLKSLSKQPHLGQVDSATRCPSSSTEIPFPAAEDMDEWRYALVDNDDRSRKRTTAADQALSTRCTSCQSGNLCHCSG
ncbi:hypothetical protein FPOAC2_01427 [Fusarium poae]|jgi:hypothetical protein|uniref:Uncharacterized protein n=2 Tax=Fusarium poae TaxID=36050 RepID=A0A1B8B3S4_FUSPO|nr:hypothetical protein FPOA_01299 [Fusarium poae]